MSVSDPLADMLTRIRNAGMAKHGKVDIPAAKMKISLAKILKAEGYVKNFKVFKEKDQGVIRIYLKYHEGNQNVITGIKRLSKPGRRVYVKKNDIPYVLNGMGVAVLSTSKGILSDRDAREQSIGGELLCSVW